nr:NFAT activation molecule 1 [Oryctolagus cuniculus]
MESWSPRLVATALLALLPWTPQRAGGQSVTHIGPPIVVSLANTFVSFRCRVTCPDIQGFKNITVGYFNKDVQGHASSEKSITCRPVPGTENKTCSLECEAVIRLPGASATGTYYCSLYWQGFTVNGDGTFILVRDSGYREPPQSSQKALLFGFTGLLTVLSVLATALLFWKKKQMGAPGKRSDPRPAGASTRPAAEAVYTALQHRETEVYACIEQEACNPPLAGNPVSQGKLHRVEDDHEFNEVYENL